MEDIFTQEEFDRLLWVLSEDIGKEKEKKMSDAQLYILEELASYKDLCRGEETWYAALEFVSYLTGKSVFKIMEEVKVIRSERKKNTQ